MMNLENIGFYTLTDERARNVSNTSPMYRCELLLTGRCNFKCTYCRGLPYLPNDIHLARAVCTLQLWINDGLKNVRFSGGEPTLYPHLSDLVRFCRNRNVERIAVSTNGSQSPDLYKKLVDDGVNDFSISLDACCSQVCDKMSGVNGKWNVVTNNIRELSKLTYVTVGVVLTEHNINDVENIVRFASGLGVDDIRIISAAQYNKPLRHISLEQHILDKHPILKYRTTNFLNGRYMRGIQSNDSTRCHLVKDDSVVVDQWHFPCIIYMREGGHPIGQVGSEMRMERVRWFQRHNTHEDSICKSNCLDVCIDYNNKCEEFRREL